jgi:fructokinase
MLPRTTPQGEAAFAPYVGGALFNTAIAVGRLGVPSGFLSGLSRDLFGEQLQATLAASHVDTSPSVVSDRPTTLAWVRLRDGHATYTFYDEGTALRMLRPEDMPPLGPEVAALVFGCISLVGEPCGSAYEALQAREAPRRVTLLDPNIRQGFVAFMGNEEAYRARLDRMSARADIWKASDEDLEWVMGPGDPEAQARAVLARGPRLVCITPGAQGRAGRTRPPRRCASRRRGHGGRHGRARATPSTPASSPRSGAPGASPRRRSPRSPRRRSATP